MPLTLIKPSGFTVSDALKGRLRPFYKYLSGIIVTGDSYEIVRDIDLDKIKEEDWNNKDKECYLALSSTTLSAYTEPFAKVFENGKRIYAFSESNPVASVNWQDVKSILNLLSFEGCVTYLEHLLKLDNKGMVLLIDYGVNTKIDIAVPVEKHLIVDGDVAYQGYIQNNSINSGYSPPRPPQMPPASPASFGEAVRVGGLILEEANLGTRRYFRDTPAIVFVSNIDPIMASVIGERVKSLDFLHSFEGIINPTLNQIRACIKTNQLKFRISLLRWPDLNPNTPPIQIDREI